MKRIPFLSVLLLLLFSGSGQIYCQDILYKKDKTILEVSILDSNGKTITYRKIGDNAREEHYLSKSVLDSIKYADGRSLELSSLYKFQAPREISVNYLGVEFNNLLNSNMNVTYERMARNGRRSLVAGLLININPGEYEGRSQDFALSDFNFNTHFFFTRFGVNFYPFNYSLARGGNFRFYNGLSLLVGAYRQISWGGTSPTYDPVTAVNFMWNINGKLYLGDIVQIQCGIDLSVMPFLTYFCPEFGLSFGF